MPTNITCNLGSDSTTAVDCNNGTLYLPTAGDCSVSSGDGSVSYIDFPTTVSCPNVTQGAVRHALRVASSRYPSGTGCGPSTTYVWVKNTQLTNCTPAVNVACTTGDSASTPVLCSEAGDPMDLTLAANCTLTGQGATWIYSGLHVSCPPSGQSTSFNITAVSSPHYGDTATCGPLIKTIYVKNDSKCSGQALLAGRPWTVSRPWRTPCDCC